MIEATASQRGESRKKEVTSMRPKRKLWLLAALPVIGVLAGAALALAGPALAATNAASPTPGSSMGLW